MEMEYNILVKKSTVCSLQVSHTEISLLHIDFYFLRFLKKTS